MFGMMEALLSFLRRQVGLRTDAADVNGSLHSKIGGVNNRINALDNKLAADIPVYLKALAKASNTVQYTHPDSLINIFTIYEMLLQCVLPVSGTARFSFKVRRGSVKIVGSGDSFENAAEFVGDADPRLYTVDVVVKKGESVQIWGRATSSSYSLLVTDIKIMYTPDATTSVIAFE